MGDNIVISSLNIGGSTTLAGLLSMLRLDKPHLVMLQEVKVNTEQLNVQVAKYGYQAVSNIDVNNPSALGTGVVWQSHLPVSDIFSFVHRHSHWDNIHSLISMHLVGLRAGRQGEISLGRTCLELFVDSLAVLVQFWLEISTPSCQLWTQKGTSMTRHVLLSKIW